MDIKQELVDIQEDGFEIKPDLVNVDELKQELIGYEVPKTEKFSDYLQPKIDHDLVLEHLQVCPTIIVKQELDNISEECGQSQFKNELLTTDCDLPTLKIESTEFTDCLIEPCEQKQGENISNPFKNILNVSKRRKQYPCPVCRTCKCTNNKYIIRAEYNCQN